MVAKFHPMKRQTPALVCLFFCWVIAASSQPPPTLISLRAVHSLTNEQASHALTVSFEANVTFFRDYENLLFVQDGDFSIFVRPPEHAQLLPGDRVLVRGTTVQSYRPIILSTSVTVLTHGNLPAPLPVDFDTLIRPDYDTRLVALRGILRSADLIVHPGALTRVTDLQLIMEGGTVEISVSNADPAPLRNLLDAQVEVVGIAGGRFDDKMQKTGVTLYASSLSNVRVLKPALIAPSALPLTPIDQIFTAFHVNDLSRRVRVHGVITYFQPGSAVVLQNGAKSLWISTKTNDPLQIGDVVDATGFPEARERFLNLNFGEITDSHTRAAVQPLLSNWTQLAIWRSNKPEGHQYDLVSIDGTVVTTVREAAQDEYVLASATGQLFTAIFRHPIDPKNLLPMRPVPVGAKIRITGICRLVSTNAFVEGQYIPFDILLRSYDDITILAGPPWISVQNLLRIIRILIFIITLALLRSWFLERKVRRNTASLASQSQTKVLIEQQRGRILEDINTSRPLTEIYLEIARMASEQLNHTRCWVEIGSGARYGDVAPFAASPRMVSAVIPSHSGPPHGALFAAFDPSSTPTPDEPGILAAAARLTSLAIETRKLYTELRHRSEFDLLTDIHNRFSLERYIDSRIGGARRTESIFALIYIDLDDFKSINDRYGHHVGDLFLQEVALRIKRLLRAEDMVARLGGDEFAILLPNIRSRVDAEDIVARIERCFHDPILVEGNDLNAAASIGIALYPQDGSNKDELFRAADEHMYLIKNQRRLLHSMENEVFSRHHTPRSRS
jgi:diguanylate cyclase (GGDEF)-like protein